MVFDSLVHTDGLRKLNHHRSVTAPDSANYRGAFSLPRPDPLGKVASQKREEEKTLSRIVHPTTCAYQRPDGQQGANYL